MKQLYFLDCSPHREGSLGVRQVREMLDGPDAPRVRARSLAGQPLAPLSAQYAEGITSGAAHDDPAFALSEQLIGELEDSDALLISTPMHNFTVPAALKLWLDYVLRKGRSFTVTPDGKVGLLRDRPTLVLVRSGAAFLGSEARQPDFLTAYLRYALSILGLHDVRFVYLQGLAPQAEDLALARRALAAFLHPAILTGDLS
ncbi:FMN-dependent NADH-azoreductase [Bordetella hinzii]|uniref:FMN dependent NADH:quinone oxidoreductase n=1 Tax=Bordetella hinzii TaxID=103855 RepID=A0AAN1RZZ3_9BORD|nr:NAD(P)H-dependent oxidoreductase [Bordetella hinzii]AKQ55882.1 FMN-dependent NADH-azoreductase [Bordetella hinzii]AKQ60414.1 FMN-dependent NADH-azoreductase [Bordetella hinzii]AZW18533.1 FMN-dependent NADH-azoreductase [Bordetella hinzii]KCB33574.1 flavodoxin-like protein [Bordetella hinzii L60]KCB46070.1 flavodoxin-like protein [Bordetella hinzii 4161]